MNKFRTFGSLILMEIEFEYDEYFIKEVISEISVLRRCGRYLMWKIGSMAQISV